MVDQHRSRFLTSVSWEITVNWDVMTESAKRAAIELIERLPEDASLEDIMYELYFRERVGRGLQEWREGKAAPHSEVIRDALDWLRSTGHPAPD